jgi:hypothetical protein
METVTDRVAIGHLGPAPKACQSLIT